MTRLSVEQLRVELVRDGTRIAPVDDVSFALDHGEILGVAGESGSGKSLTLKAIAGLLPAQSRVALERAAHEQRLDARALPGAAHLHAQVAADE